MQISQISYLSTVISCSVPNAAFSNEIFIANSKSLPRIEEDSLLDDPPKNASNILPKPPRSSKPEKPDATPEFFNPS